MPVSEKFNDTLKQLEELAAKRIKESQQVLRAQPQPGAVKRDDAIVPEHDIIEQLRKIREIEEKLKAGEKLDKDDDGIKKILRLAVRSLALEMEGLTPKQIENKLLANSFIKNDLDKEALERNFKEEIQQQVSDPESLAGDEILRMTVDPDNPDKPVGVDTVLSLNHDSENLPNVQGGIQSVLLRQNGNEIGVVLRTDKAKYSGGGNLLEWFEEKMDQRLEQIKKEESRLDDVNQKDQQAKDIGPGSPRPTPRTGKQEDQETLAEQSTASKAGPQSEKATNSNDINSEAADAGSEASSSPSPFNTTPSPSGGGGAGG